jgi:uncharacterized protein (DUF169 family)
MKNEKVKIKIELDFTYDSTALKIIEEEIKRYKEETGEDITIEQFLDRAVENMLYDRFECDYECIDGEEYERNWTIEKS